MTLALRSVGGSSVFPVERSVAHVTPHLERWGREVDGDLPI
jgi:hypothetical protein